MPTIVESIRSDRGVGVSAEAGTSRASQASFEPPAGALYQEMIKASASGRVGTPDESGTVAAFLMGRDGSFITGSDLLIDGGVIAAVSAGRFQVQVG